MSNEYVVNHDSILSGAASFRRAVEGRAYARKSIIAKPRPSTTHRTKNVRCSAQDASSCSSRMTIVAKNLSGFMTQPASTDRPTDRLSGHARHSNKTRKV